jgi:hypothetical protein
MTGYAAAATPYMMGLDCLEPLTAEVCAAAKALRIGWVGRYLENLRPAERDIIFAHDLAILPLIEGRAAELLSGSFGEQTGAESIRRALSLGVPPRVHLTTDLEECSGADRRDVTGYSNGVSSVVERGGYGSLLYVGAGQPLEAHELYALLAGPYWRGASLGIPEVQCGWSILQLYPLSQPLPGTSHRVDRNVIQSDLKGRTPILWWPPDADVSSPTAAA